MQQNEDPNALQDRHAMQEKDAASLRAEINQQLLWLSSKRQITKLQLSLLQYRFALTDTHEWWTLKAIALQLKITREKTMQLEARAHVRLRKHTTYMDLLRMYLHAAAPPSRVLRSYSWLWFEGEAEKEES